MKLSLLILFCVLNITLVLSVPETWTKKCEDSSFCRRCRKRPTTQSPFDVQLDSWSSNEKELHVDILNTKTSNNLTLKLECLESNTFHFEIDEKTPIKPRFKLKDVVIDAERSIRNIQVNRIQNSLNVSCDSNLAVIEASPFKMHFYRNNILTLTVNGKGLMTYEHLRLKVTPAADDDEDPDSWEETFDGYTDSKPNGPEAVALDFKFDSSEVLFGIPEHHDTFALRRTAYGEPYRVFTVDMTLFEVDSRMPNYGAIPVIYGHARGRTAGIFWHNAADTYVDIHDTETAHFISEGGVIDVFVFLGPTPNDAFSQYTKITGVGSLPQLFTLAYHQSKWGYLSQEEITTIVEEFDKNDIPLDTMWLDIDYTDGMRYFTWNKQNFTNPLGLMETLKSTGRRLVHIIDPHIKVDENYFFFNESRSRGLIVKTADGGDFYGNCWPGNSTYLDYFNPVARKYYADQYLLENFKDNSIETGIWNDMNEPAVFDAPEKTFPRDSVHTNGVETVEHRLIHNIYGFLHTKGTFDGLMRRSNGAYRPFILTRSFFAGTQKYSAIWTGDNTAGWPYLKASISACLAISVSGISFCGSDIGGFFGDPDDELFVRWNQAAAFQPFFRNHASKQSPYREPYLKDEKTRKLATAAMRKRYELLPFWYTLFYEHEKTGYPVMNPMLTYYPNDANVFTIDTQYMLSDKLLVSPVLEPQSKWVLVRFPSTDGKQEGDIWYDIYDDYKKYDVVGTQAIAADEDKIPVFQRGGTIIPTKKTERKASVHMRDDPLTIYVAVDKNMMAKGNVYIDDETSYDYRTKGIFKMVDFEFVNDTLTVSENDNKNFKPKIERVYFAGLEVPKKAVKKCKGNDGKTAELQVSSVSDEFFYVSIGESLAECEMSWTMTLSSGMMSTISKSLLFFVVIFSFVQKLFL